MRRSRYLLVSVMVVGAMLGVAPASAEPAWQVDLSRAGSGSTNVLTDGSVRLGSGENRAASVESGLRTGFAVYPRTLATPANTFAAVVRSVVPAGAELAIDVRGWVSDEPTRMDDRSGWAGDGPSQRGAGPDQASGNAGRVSGEANQTGAGPDQVSRAGQASGEAGRVEDSASQAGRGRGFGRVRGLADDESGQVGGRWTEWVEIRPGVPGVLPVTAARVEVRVMLSAAEGAVSPVLDGLAVTPSVTERAAGRAVSVAGLSYPVFATREGLVGGTTANGHEIVARDHFVALPSRRGLSARNAGDYSVRVCADNGRCEWAPVWDVGPWNTRDDYWAGPTVRQEWHDLPQGKPASQAAYQDGYNGGRDQFGRRVANPAGIDLADGTFWDGLKLKNNAWVTVTYQWTGTNPAGYVRTRGGEPLNVRTGPHSQAPIVGMAANYAQVRLECVVAGEQVAGTQGTTNGWYRLAAGMFASAAYVSGGGGVQAC